GARVVEPARPVSVARLLAEALDAAEGEQGSSPRFVGGETACAAGLGFHRHVETQLIVQIALGCLALPQRPEANEQSAKAVHGASSRSVDGEHELDGRGEAAPRRDLRVQL